MLEDWKVEQQMVLKKNPNYFKKGLPYVDEVILRIIPDEANIVAALRTGQIHHAFIEDNKNYNLLKDEKTLTGYRSSRLGYDFLNINASRGPLKDVRVRQAISWTVDRSPGHAGGRLRLRPPHRAGHRADEAVAAPRGAVDALLQARRGQGQEAHGRRGRRPAASP